RARRRFRDGSGGRGRVPRARAGARSPAARPARGRGTSPRPCGPGAGAAPSTPSPFRRGRSRPREGAHRRGGRAGCRSPAGKPDRETAVREERRAYNAGRPRRPPPGRPRPSREGADEVTDLALAVRVVVDGGRDLLPEDL